MHTNQPKQSEIKRPDNFMIYVKFWDNFNVELYVKYLEAKLDRQLNTNTK